MNKKIENQATIVVLEILGILGVDTIVKTLYEAEENITDPDEKEDAIQQRGYFIINYLFKNIRQIQPQLEELVSLFAGDDVNLLKGIAQMKDDKEVVSFFTGLLGEVMTSV